MSQNSPKEIKIIFTFQAQDKDIIKCDIKEKLINIFKNYSKKKGIELESLYFLCNGEIINDFEKTFEQLANTENKNNMEINILVYKVNESKIDEDSIINVYFLEEKNTKRIKCKRKDKIKDICNNYEIQTNFKSNSIVYKYKGVELDLEKTFDSYDSINNDFFIKVSSKTIIYIIFVYLGVLYNVECYKEDKIEDICSDFASKNNINKKKVMFKYKDNLIEQNKTLNQFLNENNLNININEIKIDVIDFHGFPSFLSIHKIKIIIISSIVAASVTISVPIIVSKNGHTPVPTTIPTTAQTTDFTNIPNNISTTVATTIPSTVLTTSPTITPSNIATNGYTSVPTITPKTILESSIITDSDISTTEAEATEIPIICQPGYALIENECQIDYFIKAIYFSEAYERIQLISNNFNLNKIKKMTIDGIIIEPTKFYTFNESGEHIIYYSFIRYTNNSLLSMDEGSGIFSCIEKLLYVEFSNYSANNSYYDFYHEEYKYYPDVRFYGMFNNCINLKSVDISKLSIFYALYGGYHSDLFELGYYASGYFNSLDYMFNNCISLNSFNFSIPIYDSCLIFKSAKFMFNNCISLISIDLSKLCLDCIESLDLSNMFSNCISLKTFISSSFYCDNIHTNMSYMFYNCSSLISLDFPSYSLKCPDDMSYSFAFCSSLQEFILELSGSDVQTPKSMSNAFRNCTSLVSIDLNFYTEYEDMSSLFMGCTSLTHISSYFVPSYTKYMNNMFYDCHSLKSIDFYDLYPFNHPSWDPFYCPSWTPHYYWEPHYSCHFNTSNLIDISKMFLGCSSLTTIDLSMFITQNIKNYEGMFYNCKNLSYIDISSFSHNNLPSSNLSIFDENYPFNTTIIIEEQFSKRIKIQSDSSLIIEDNIYKGPFQY